MKWTKSEALYLQGAWVIYVCDENDEQVARVSTNFKDDPEAVTVNANADLIVSAPHQATLITNLVGDVKDGCVFTYEELYSSFRYVQQERIDLMAACESFMKSRKSGLIKSVIDKMHAREAKIQKIIEDIFAEANREHGNNNEDN